MTAAPATCNICHKQTTDYRYHNAGMTVGILIVCKPCDEAYERKQQGGKA